MNSAAFVKRGKLVVHIAENGHSYKIVCDGNTIVEAIQKFLESACGIPFTDQLLLCVDLKLEPQCPLSAYKLPSDDREVFLFNKSRMRSHSPHPALENVKVVDVPDPPLSSSCHSPHPLDDASEPALKALPSYERQFEYHFQRGSTIHSRTLAKMETCKRLLHEQEVQERALDIARDNFDHFYKIILRKYTGFVKFYSHQHRSHTNLLVNFGRNIEKLRSIKILPPLQTDNFKCLLDFVKEESLRKTVEDCSSSHRQFETKVSEFKQEFGDLRRNADNLFCDKVSSLVKDLDFSIKDHQRFIDEQKSILQALSNDVNTVKKLVEDCLSSQLSSSLRPHDAVSALGPMYDSHEKSYLPKIQSCEHTISNLLDFCMSKKNDMNISVHTYMQKISYMQYTIKEVSYKFSVFQEALRRQNDQFEQLRVVRGIGPSYRACFAEIVRRKAHMKIYMGKAGQLAEKLARERDAEIRRREEFFKVHSTHIPWDILTSMGLYDTPNSFHVDVTPYDSNLLDVDLLDLDRYAPESVLGLSSKSEKHGLSKIRFSMSDDVSRSAEVDHPELPDGSESTEVENAKLKAELASKIALICYMSAELEYESLDESKLDGLLKNASERTSEALHLKDEYEKHLQSMLKAKYMQCESYEKRIEELEQKLSNQHPRELKHSADEGVSNPVVSTATDDKKLDVLGIGESHMEVFTASSSLFHEQHDKAQDVLDDNLTDSSGMLNAQLDSLMFDLHRGKGHPCDKDNKEAPSSEGGALDLSNVIISLSLQADAISSESCAKRDSDCKLGDCDVLELQNSLAEKSSQLNNAQTKIQALNDGVSKLAVELEISRKLLDESQMDCARLEKWLHEAREEAQKHLCTADRRASENNAMRVCAVRMHGFLRRLRTCVSSSGPAAFADTLRDFAQSLASASDESNDDSEFLEGVRALADKAGLLSRLHNELLDKFSEAVAVNEQLKKELEEKKKLANTLYAKHQREKQANKEKISFGRLGVHQIAAFVLNTLGHYEAINRSCAPYYYLSTESVALFTDNHTSRPIYIVGQVVHMERQIVLDETESNRDPRVDILTTSETGSGPLALKAGPGTNPYDLPVGCDYFVVTVAMLPDNTVHLPSPPS